MRYANSFDLTVTAEGMSIVTFKHVVKIAGPEGLPVEQVERYEPITMLNGFVEQMMPAWKKTIDDQRKALSEGWTPPAGETAVNGLAGASGAPQPGKVTTLPRRKR